MGGLGQGLVDHTIQLLTHENVIVSLEEDGDMSIHHQLVDGLIPAGPVSNQVISIAPLEGIGKLDAASSSTIDVMSKNKLISGGAGFEGLFEPPVLGFAQGDIPQVALLLFIVVSAKLVIHSFSRPVRYRQINSFLHPVGFLAFPDRIEDPYRFGQVLRCQVQVDRHGRGEFEEIDYEVVTIGSRTVDRVDLSFKFSPTGPDGLCDVRTGVVCSPNNYAYGADEGLPDGILRISALANFDHWAQLPEDQYALEKLRWYDRLTDAAVRFVPDYRAYVIDTDMFTPTTIRRFTWHNNGAVYGAPEKRLEGTTHLENLFLCGSDQGLVGIIGAIVSGITVANKHCLKD